MQEQLTELQLKLAKEEEEKANVTKLNQDLKQVIDFIQSYFYPRVWAVIFHFDFPPLTNYLKFPTDPRNNPLTCIIARWVLNVSGRNKQIRSMSPVIVKLV